MNDCTVLARDLAFPEGPAFDAEGGLWFVEHHSDTIVRYAADGVERFRVGGQPNGLMAWGDGGFLFCDAADGRGRIRSFDPATGATEDIVGSVNGEDLRKPNDLALDSSGNLVFTCPGGSWDSPIGYVCRTSPTGDTVKVAEGLAFPNGLAFTGACRSLVVAETRGKRLWKGDWNHMDGTLTGFAPWATVGGETGPDGMAVGEDARVYVALFGSGTIVAVGPDGDIETVAALPGANPTNCAFDPTGNLGLVVTEAEKGTLLSIRGLGPGLALFRNRSHN